MNKKKQWIDAFLVTAVLLCATGFIYERISIVEHFAGHYKSAGGYFNSNRYFLPIYLCLSVFKLGYLFSLLYYFLPQQESRVKKVTRILGFSLLIYGLEWATMNAVYHALSAATEGLRMEWTPRPVENYTYFLGLSILGGLLYFARIGSLHFQDLKEVFTQGAALRRIKAQNEPHFLFNSLNHIYALSLKKGVPEITDALDLLTQNLRFVYQHQHHRLISAQEEVENVLNYIELQKMRIDQQLVDIRVEVEGDLSRDYQMPPLSFLNFVENAFQHGISYQSPSFIWLHIYEGKSGLCLSIQNSSFSPVQKKHGGIEMSKTLLETGLGRQAYQLNIEPKADVFHVELVLRK